MAAVGMDMTCSVLPFESTLTTEFYKVSYGLPLSIPEAHILVKLINLLQRRCTPIVQAYSEIHYVGFRHLCIFLLFS